jgi:microcystin-dependent protein
MDFYLSQIVMWGLGFAPRGWMACNGQLLSIAQNTALFSLLGTTYGGDGQTTFALPDMRGRAPVHFGQGRGLSTNWVLGQAAGAESTTLTQTQMPMHTHSATATSTSTTTATLHAESTQADARNPLAKMLATPPANAQVYADPIPADDKAMAPGSIIASTDTTTTVTVNPAGGSQPFSLMQPALAVNFCICTDGLFPSRN